MPIDPKAEDLAVNTIRNLEHDLSTLTLRQRTAAVRSIVQWGGEYLVDEGKYLGMLDEQGERKRKANGGSMVKGTPRPPSGHSKLVMVGRGADSSPRSGATRTAS